MRGVRVFGNRVYTQKIQHGFETDAYMSTHTCAQEGRRL
jgi:hypothetical protein